MIIKVNNSPSFIGSEIEKFVKSIIFIEITDYKKFESLKKFRNKTTGLYEDKLK